MFFTYIDQVLSPGVDLNLTISKTANGLTVLVMPRINGLKDAAKNILSPMTLRGLPQELNDQFFPAISSPLRRSSNILVNMSQYESQQEEAEKSSKAAKDLKEKEAKEKKEKKDKYDAAVRKAEELENAGKLQEAIVQYVEAKKYAVDKAAESVNEKIGAIKKKMSQGSLFDAPAPQSPNAGQSRPVETAPVSAPQQDNAVRSEASQATKSDPFENIITEKSQGMRPSTGVQPNEKEFGLFDTTQQQNKQTQQSGMGAPDFTRFGGGQVHRDNEYDEYEDFPKDMPPLYMAKQMEAGVQNL